MSNKETLQTYNARLVENNTNLADILTTVENLPEANSGGEQEMNYSLNEHVIGTWVDGRPLYQKTIYYTSGWTLGSESKLTHGIENVDEIWLDSAFYRRSDNTRQIVPSFHTLYDAWANCLYDISDTDFRVRFGTLNNSFTVKYFYVTFNYTKTTDIATA